MNQAGLVERAEWKRSKMRGSSHRLEFTGAGHGEFESVHDGNLDHRFKYFMWWIIFLPTKDLLEKIAKAAFENRLSFSTCSGD